ncbi:MAG: hypothetical protein R3C03_03970 [Pirellulaceae bacterium]
MSYKPPDYSKQWSLDPIDAKFGTPPSSGNWTSQAYIGGNQGSNNSGNGGNYGQGGNGGGNGGGGGGYYRNGAGDSGSGCYGCLLFLAITVAIVFHYLWLTSVYQRSFEVGKQQDEMMQMQLCYEPNKNSGSIWDIFHKVAIQGSQRTIVENEAWIYPEQYYRYIFGPLTCTSKFFLQREFLDDRHRNSTLPILMGILFVSLLPIGKRLGTLKLPILFLWPIAFVSVATLKWDFATFPETWALMIIWYYLVAACLLLACVRLFFQIINPTCTKR